MLTHTRKHEVTKTRNLRICFVPFVSSCLRASRRLIVPLVRWHQNLTLTFTLIDRIGRTESTCPNVGELTTVSTAA